MPIAKLTGRRLRRDKENRKQMEIHTENKDMKTYLKDASKLIDKSQDRKWSEYELRLLIQDELSSQNNKSETTKETN